MNLRTLSLSAAIAAAMIFAGAAEAATKYVAVSTANVRAAPNGKIVTTVKRGTALNVTKNSKGWWKISSRNARYNNRWIANSVLCGSPNCATSSQRSGSRAITRTTPPKQTFVTMFPTNPIKVSTSNVTKYDDCPCTVNKICLPPDGQAFCYTPDKVKDYGHPRR